MSEPIISAKELTQAWRDLAADVNKNKKLQYERFEPIFSQTYSLLAEQLSESALDKTYVEMVAEAYLFANIEDESLDHACFAAFVLTERMLNRCAFCSVPVPAAPPSIYVAEARKEVFLDFLDVNESINRLTNIFKDIYWNNV